MPATVYAKKLAPIMKSADAAIRQEWTKELDRIGMSLRTHYNDVVLSWKHRPSFAFQRSYTRRLLSIVVYPTGAHANLWEYIDLGTKRHIIRARRKPYLSFRTGYQARTAPVARYNVGLGKATGKLVKVKQVLHPGTKARKFTITYLSRLSPPFSVRMQEAIRRGARRVS